jgi:hypothetical protein
MELLSDPEGNMFSRNQTRLILVVSIVLLVAFSAHSKPRKMRRIETGSWGATHIRVDVGPSSATVDYDCAHGTIDGPLTYDSRGHFTWHGKYTREGPGPIRVDQENNSQRATYTGTVSGGTITLTVKLNGSSDAIGTYTLKRGAAGRIFKCK